MLRSRTGRLLERRKSATEDRKMTLMEPVMPDFGAIDASDAPVDERHFA
jgi:hypothetical protein